MMERISLGVFYLSGWFIFSTSGFHHYHYVAKEMTWTDAQTYCREKYTDLATIENEEDLNQLYNIVSSADHDWAWIGLNGNTDWLWSDGYRGSGAEFRNWQQRTDNEPDFSSGGDFCVNVDNRGGWWYHDCSLELPFFCYNGTHLDPQFVYISESMNWSSAQRYCRENYIDLAIVRNDAENQQIQKVTQSGGSAWIGLIGIPDTYWSDGSNTSFRYWDKTNIPDESSSVLCAASWVKSGKWWPVHCNYPYPFVCHGITQPAKRQVVKLRMKLGDPSVNLNDPAVKAQILKKFQDRLKEQGVSGATLKWKEQPDGKVFHKEGKEKKKKSRKKTEL